MKTIVKKVTSNALAFGIAEAMAIGVDRDIDEVGVVERGHRAIEGGVVEIPVGRPFLPQHPEGF